MVRSEYYRNILEDLLTATNEKEDECAPPYSRDDTIDEKFNATVCALFQAKRMRNRPLQLVNAYFLGQILEEKSDPIEKRPCFVRKLTAYYRITAIRMYYIFKIFGTAKIVKTTRTTLTAIRGISTEEFQDLVLKSSLIFNGVENWEGNDVTSSHVTGLPIDITDIMNSMNI